MKILNTIFDKLSKGSLISSIPSFRRRKYKIKRGKLRKLFSRNCRILPYHFGKRIYGKINNKIESLEVQEHHIGHLFGEYFFTKKIGFTIHLEKKGKKRKKKD
jgi:ribosomal protein S19